MKCPDGCGLEKPEISGYEPEVKHTPTPWKSEKTTPQTQTFLKMNGMAGNPDEFELWDANGDCIGVVKDKKTGAKIVRAVNIHEALLKVAKEYIYYIETGEFKKYMSHAEIKDVIAQAEARQ